MKFSKSTLAIAIALVTVTSFSVVNSSSYLSKMKEKAQAAADQAKAMAAQAKESAKNVYYQAKENVDVMRAKAQEVGQDVKGRLGNLQERAKNTISGAIAGASTSSPLFRTYADYAADPATYQQGSSE